MTSNNQTSGDRPAANATAASGFPDALLRGYLEYRDQAHRSQRSEFERLAVYGQEPKVMVISCCDSRVTPESRNYGCRLNFHESVSLGYSFDAPRSNARP